MRVGLGVKARTCFGSGSRSRPREFRITELNGLGVLLPYAIAPLEAKSSSNLLKALHPHGRFFQ